MSKVNLVGFSKNVKVPVKVELVDDNGDEQTVEFKIVYRRMDREQGQRIMDEATKRAEQSRELQVELSMEEDAKKKDKIRKKIRSLDDAGLKTLKDRIVGWEDFVDQEGDEVPFSNEVLDLLLSHAVYQQKLDEGMWVATGARIKN